MHNFILVFSSLFLALSKFYFIFFSFINYLFRRKQMFRKYSNIRIFQIRIYYRVLCVEIDKKIVNISLFFSFLYFRNGGTKITRTVQSQ